MTKYDHGPPLFAPLGLILVLFCEPDRHVWLFAVDLLKHHLDNNVLDSRPICLLRRA